MTVLGRILWMSSGCKWGACAPEHCVFTLLALSGTEWVLNKLLLNEWMTLFIKSANACAIASVRFLAASNKVA